MVVKVVNKTITTSTMMAVAPAAKNPAPGICLPVIINFCQYHKMPYNFTVFPNYIGHFGQRDAQQVILSHFLLIFQFSIFPLSFYFSRNWTCTTPLLMYAATNSLLFSCVLFSYRNVDPSGTWSDLVEAYV